MSDIIDMLKKFYKLWCILTQGVLCSAQAAADLDEYNVLVFHDDFSGQGPLQGYFVNNASSLPDVAQVNGRYRAALVNNANEITLHYNQHQGRLDAVLVKFPFATIVRNIGIGTVEDSQIAPATKSNPYSFSGVQVHVKELDERMSSHVVVGHRGGRHYTIEGKNTVDGNSDVNDIGVDVMPDGRADLLIVGNNDRELTVYYQIPNTNPERNPDNWQSYGRTGKLPGRAPSFGEEVYVGLITYAYREMGIPFVGTADSFTIRAKGTDKSNKESAILPVSPLLLDE